MLYNLSKVTQLKICGERSFYRFERDEDGSWMTVDGMYKFIICIFYFVYLII